MNGAWLAPPSRDVVPTILTKLLDKYSQELLDTTVKEVINQFPQDRFSFDELRKKVPGDYESLKEIIFDLLAESKPSLAQVFDQDAKAMRFTRSHR